MTTPAQPLRIESLCDGEGVAARQAGLPADARQLHREVLRAFLAAGRAPRRGEISGVVGVEQEAAFRQLVDIDLVGLDADGRVIVAYPFSGRSTGHTVQLEGGPVLHAMCAIDALGIPLMTGRDGAIVSADPGDAHSISVERRGAAWRWAPVDAVVLLAQESTPGPASDCLCPAITFHASRGSAEAHLRRRPELAGVVLDQALAIEVAGRSFGALLDEHPTPTARGEAG